MRNSSVSSAFYIYMYIKKCNISGQQKLGINQGKSVRLWEKYRRDRYIPECFPDVEVIKILCYDALCKKQRYAKLRIVRYSFKCYSRYFRKVREYKRESGGCMKEKLVGGLQRFSKAMISSVLYLPAIGMARDRFKFCVNSKN